MSDAEQIFVVDRVEGDSIVLVADDDGEVQVVDTSRIASRPSEGTVLRVPSSVDGGLDWDAAVIDEELRQDRLDAARALLDRLKDRDPGGDIVL